MPVLLGALSGALQIAPLVGHWFARQCVCADTAVSKRNDNDKENRMIHATIRRLALVAASLFVTPAFADMQIIHAGSLLANPGERQPRAALV